MPKIERDKWKHFLVGIVMGATLQTFAWFGIPSHPVAGILITFVMIIVISYGFELYSLFTKRGHYEILDAVAGIIGGIVGMAITLPLLAIS